jgi:hypothetical protein
VIINDPMVKRLRFRNYIYLSFVALEVSTYLFFYSYSPSLQIFFEASNVLTAVLLLEYDALVGSLSSGSLTVVDNEILHHKSM